MSLEFYRYADEGDRFVERLAESLGYPQDKARAGRILRAVLSALRQQLILDESLQVIAQLPMFLKALYVDGWNPHRRARIKDRQGFLREVVRSNRAAEKDFQDMDMVEHATRVVFEALREYVSEGEMLDIQANFPKDGKELLH